MIRVTIDPSVVREIAPEAVDVSPEAQERILEELNKEVVDLLNVLEPVCTDRVGSNELRRVLALKGYKICY